VGHSSLATGVLCSFRQRCDGGVAQRRAGVEKAAAHRFAGVVKAALAARSAM